jgi:hypothetical protein
MSTNEGNTYDMVLIGRRVTVDEMANRLHSSHGSAYRNVYNSQFCINECTWTSANNIWIVMVINMTLFTESSL